MAIGVKPKTTNIQFIFLSVFSSLIIKNRGAKGSAKMFRGKIVTTRNPYRESYLYDVKEPISSS